MFIYVSNVYMLKVEYFYVNENQIMFICKINYISSIIIMTNRLSHGVMTMSSIHITQIYYHLCFIPSIKRNYLFILLFQINFTLLNLLIYQLFYLIYIFIIIKLNFIEH